MIVQPDYLTVSPNLEISSGRSAPDIAQTRSCLNLREGSGRAKRPNVEALDAKRV